MITGFGDRGRWFSAGPGSGDEAERLSRLAHTIAAAVAGTCAFPAPTTHHLTVLDTPDHRLRGAGSALILVAGELILLGQGRPLRAPWTPAQGAAAAPAAVVNLPKSLAVVGEAAGGMDKRLLALGSFTAHLRADNIRAAGKVVLRAAWLSVGATAWLRLEAVRGHDDVLDLAARAVLADGLIEIANDPLLAHALALTGRYPVPAELPVCADPDQPALAMIRILLAAGVARLRALEGGTREDADASFLHRYRVTLRVLRSVIWQLKDALADDVAQRIKDELGDLARAANRLRDLDVQLADPQALGQDLPPELEPGFAGLLDSLKAERTAAQAAYAALLDSPAHHARLEALLGLTQAPSKAIAGKAALRPIAGLARARCWALYRGMRSRARAVDANTPDHDLHELRIRGKRLRYLLDLCGPVAAPDDFARLTAELKALQGVLGDFNDAAVQHTSLLALPFNRQMPAEQGVVVGVLAANTAMRRQRLRGELAPALATFASNEVRDEWRALFADKEEDDA
jgi:CHAD domain-containing protein